MAQTGPTISELVQATGLPSRKLSERSGGLVAHSQFDRLKHGKVGWPDRPEAINATAQALGITPREVVYAYARQFGIDIDGDQSLLATMLPRSTRNLTHAQALALADLIRAFTHGPDNAEDREALSLRNFDLGEVREVSRLWTELKTRAETEPPAVSYALTHLADILEDAIRERTG